MDNLESHKGQAVRRAIRAAGAKMLGNDDALAPSNAQHRTVTNPRPCIGVDHVLIARNPPKSRIKKPLKT